MGRISIPVTEREREALQDQAEADDRPLSMFLRRLVGLPGVVPVNDPPSKEG